MKLKYNLSSKTLAALKLEQNEEIFYSIPHDVDAEGGFLSDSYVTVTDKRILVTVKGELRSEVLLEDIDEAVAEPMIGCGIFAVKKDGEEAILARYSSKHLGRFSYISRGCKLLKQGERVAVESEEPEKTCEKCGRALPGTSECPNCANKKRGMIRQMMSMLMEYKALFALTVFLMLLATVVTLLNPTLQKVLVDDVLGNANATFKSALVVLAGMFILGMSVSLVNAAKYYTCSKLGTNLSMNLRRRLYGKVQVLSLSFINDRRPGELMNRVVRDTARVKEFMSELFCDLATVAILFVVCAVYMLFLNWKLALLAFGFIPPAVLVSVAFKKAIHRRFHMQYVKEDDVHSNLQDVISGMAVVKTYGREEAESQHFNETADEFLKVQKKNEVFWAIFFPSLQFLMSIGTYFVTFFGGRSALLGDMSIGELVQFTAYTSMLYQYVNWLTNLPRRLMNMVTAMERINDVLNQSPKITDKAAIKHKIEGHVRFDHASFGYKSYKPVLEDICLDIKPGEMIGLVGASGTGKSTLINLIMHLYEVDSGKILVDDIDIRDIALDDYHSQIGVVLQETFLFSGTIINNIKFAKPDATYEEVIRAAKMANAHDFICKTPDGYNTYVGERGFNLSGGERQRIAIARAILNNPNLLILDEATASLDTESEYLIQKALDRLRSGRTTFAIAHRLSTLKDADRLVVIDGHNIAEIGTHNELMEKKGIYYGLVTAQLEMNALAKNGVIKNE